MIPALSLMTQAVKRHAAYLKDVFEDYDRLIEHCVKELTGREFDTLVGTGLSGTLILLPVAKRLGVHAAVVRKDEDCHSSLTVEGTIGKRWIMLDDQVASGVTARRVIKAVAAHLARIKKNACIDLATPGLCADLAELEVERDHTTEFAGVFAYLGGEKHQVAAWFGPDHFRPSAEARARPLVLRNRQRRDTYQGAGTELQHPEVPVLG